MPALTIDTQQTLHQISQSRSILSLTARKLSSGQRIVHAGIDAAGLGIAQALSAELQSQTQASRNVNDGIGLVQTAEGGLSQIGDNLSRLRELTVAASSGTLSSTQREAMNLEANAIIGEINRVGGSTSFNGQQLLDGSLAGGTGVQAGTQAGDTIDIAVADSRAAALGITTTDNLLTEGSSQAFLATVDQAIGGVSSRRAGLGATQNQLSSAGLNLQRSSEATASARSRIADADLAEESANFVKQSIAIRAGLSVLAQAGKLSQSSLALLG